MRKHKLELYEAEEIRIAYAQGIKQDELARKYKVTQQSISKVIRGRVHRRAGGPVPRRRVYHSRIGQKEKAGIMAAAAVWPPLSLREIGDRYNISASYAGSIIRGDRRKSI